LLRRFERLRPGEAAISVVTFGELMYGAEKSSHRSSAIEQLRELLLFLPSLPLPEGSGEAYGKIRADLESRGQMISNNDLWIAAHAIALDVTLVTNNKKKFRRVRNLKIQNWTA
jgi:tRNA(fMet)-specific endonuclease VapC